MIRVAGLSFVFVVALVVAGASGISAESDSADKVTFRVVDVYVDADAPIAAYQVEVSADRGEATVVGVEGGEAPLDEPPFYDPAALEGGRIIVAAFNTDKALPAGRHRVASLHVREMSDGVHYTATLRAAADSAGLRHRPRVYVEPRPEVTR